MKKIAIAGFGMEGKALAKRFEKTHDVHVFDEAPIEDVQGMSVHTHNTLRIPQDFPVVYKSPGIPTHKLTTGSNTVTTNLTNDVLKAVRDKSIGVTGTKGKSTVASLIHHVLVEAGHTSVLFGNIGVADISLIEKNSDTEVFVFELSSYQLEHVTHAPKIAVFTNFFPEHLNHHGSLDAYRSAKERITTYQTEEDVFIPGPDITVKTKARVVQPPQTKPFETTLQGDHNQTNCLLAFSALTAYGIDEATIRKHIASFKPLPYRLECVGTYADVTFYDDSLATVPEATLASIRALKHIDTLIVGGEDRGVSFESLAKQLQATEIATFIALPDTGEKITAEVRNKTFFVHSMEEAVSLAYEKTPKGGVVLLSNASPSFNVFTDYKDKSGRYRNAIERCAQERT